MTRARCLSLLPTPGLGVKRMPAAVLLGIGLSVLFAPVMSLAQTDGAGPAAETATAPENTATEAETEAAKPEAKSPATEKAEAGKPAAEKPAVDQAAAGKPATGELKDKKAEGKKPAGSAAEPPSPTLALPEGVTGIVISSQAPVSLSFATEVERPDADCRRTASVDSKPHFGRNGVLTDREFAMARTAWAYFEKFYQEDTGLVNAVGSFPSTTMWDTASYISALVSAYELCIIDKRKFDTRITLLLRTLRNLVLFKGQAPNKVYHTETGEKVNYANKPGDIGFSALDLGRLLVWLKILKERYPYLANSVDGVPMRWNFCNIVQDDGRLNGSYVTGEGEVKYVQEGRLGYEEYAAKGFALWGFDVSGALDPRPLEYTTIFDVQVPYDGRDPRVFKNQNYVLTEGYILDGLEMGWDLPGDLSNDDGVASHGWRAEFANRIYLVQQRRFEQTGMITARSEHQVEGKPFFVYDAIFADGYAWNTLDPTQEYQPDRAAVAAKAAIGLWSLWDTDYTDLLFETVADLSQPDRGFYEGIYENGSGYIPLQTANNNGVILAALLYKVQGPILQRLNQNTQVWDTAMVGTDLRGAKCHPQTMLREIALPDCANLPAIDPPVPAASFKYCRPMLTVDGIAASDCRPEEHHLAPPEPQLVLPQMCLGKVKQP